MRTGAGVNFPEGSAADSSLWPHHRQASPPPGELLLWERGPRTSGKSSHAVPSVWVSCLPQAGGEALPLSWCLALRQEDPEMPSPHVWPAVMAAGLGPAGRLAGHAHAGSRGLHTAAGSACEHVRRWKTPGSDDPAPEVVQCEPCGFLLVPSQLRLPAVPSPEAWSHVGLPRSGARRRSRARDCAVHDTHRRLGGPALCSLLPPSP
ncbi:uncharacterized protein LOC113890944 isoform X3 [Bos indicus x Bos taurus]|uniref:uncharacterized protein LOC113890944 isoform X3 n=1 Tax=Bos indicus x Bos taurus TaxID=30522 RepID=UPI000F7D2B06|nr:uncharacterized protein LOC113890944 isoform X3 [Bos indicus x Bos taurus]